MSNPYEKRWKAQKAGGFSLIELLLVLAIIAALAVAAFIVYPRVRAGSIASAEAKKILAAQATIRALFTTNDYRNITNAVASEAGAFPSSMVNPDGTLENQWGGEVLITPSNPNGSRGSTTPTTPRRHFRIIYRNVPADVCIRLVGTLEPHFGTIRLSSSNGASGDGIVIKNTYSLGESQVPLDHSELAYRCQARSFDGEDSAGSSLIFVSK